MRLEALYLLFLTLLPVAQHLLAKEEPLPKAKGNFGDVKLITIKDVPGSQIPIGELDLGRIGFEEPVEVVFTLRNSTDRVLNINGVKPSCACTLVELKVDSLSIGETSSSPGRIRVKGPKGRGSVLIANVALFSEKSGDTIGLISIKGNVDRPLYLPKDKYDLTLTEHEQCEFKIPLYVDSRIPVSSLLFNDPLELLTCEFVRNSIESDECTVVLKGKREKLLSAKYTSIAIGIDINGQRISDSVQLGFYDGTLLRVIPRLVKVNKGEASFVIFSQSKIELDRLRVSSETGDHFNAEIQTRSKSIFSVNVRLPEMAQVNRLRVSDGHVEVWVDLELDHTK